MRKFILIPIVALVLLFQFSCSNNYLEDYKEAVAKTDSIQKGQELVEIEWDVNIDTSKMSKEEVERFNYFRNVNARCNIIFNNETGKTISRNYFNFGGMGFDADYYDDGQQKYIKMPIVGKYIVINEEEIFKIVPDGAYQEDLEFTFNEEIFNEIEKVWLDLLEKKDVFRGENNIISTPEGEVKARKYSIVLEDSQVKRFVKEVITIIKESDEFKKANGKITTSWIDDCNFSDFSYEAYVDIDGYIVEENFHMKMEIIHEENIKPTSFTLDIKGQKWDIEKDIEMDFPILTDENTLPFEKIQEGMPFMFKNE